MTIDPTKALPLHSYKDIMEKPLPDIPWVIEPLFAAGDRNLLYGPWGSFKSWLLIDLGLHVAAGQNWLGFFEVSQARPVLYIDEEMPEYVFKRRVKQLGQGAGFGEADLPFQLLSKAGVTFDKSGAVNLLEALEKSQFMPEVVIVETLRRVLDGNENEAADISQFWRNIDPLIQAGVVLVLSHHTHKPSKDGARSIRDQASGSTDIMAGLDSALAVQPIVNASVRLTHVKSRAAEELSPFTICLECEVKDGPVKLVLTNSPLPTSTMATEEGRGVDLVMRYFDENGQGTISTGNILKHLETHRLKERTCERVLKLCEQTGYIQRVSRGQWKRTPPPVAA